jgi:hypothetical protein
MAFVWVWGHGRLIFGAKLGILGFAGLGINRGQQGAQGADIVRRAGAARLLAWLA